MTRKLLLITILLFSSLFLAPPVSALEAGDVVMKVSPAEQELQLAPGLTVGGKVTVENIGRQPFTFNLEATPYQALNEAYDPDFVTENSYTKLHNWITFPQTSYRLEPGESVEAPFVVTVPADVPGGGQYAAIMVETRDTIDEESTVRTIGHIASKLYAHVEGEEHIGGVLVDHSMPSLLFGTSLAASATVKNDGNVDFRVAHELRIKDFFTGREVLSPETLAADGTTPGRANPVVLPGTTRTNRLVWNDAPQLGVYRVQQRISFLDQNYDFEHIVVFCPIWLVVLIAAFILVLIFYLVVRAAKRRRQRPQVF